MNKAYNRINWENYPSDSTPLNEDNLNKMDVAINEIDNRVISLDTTKLPVATAYTMVKDVEFDEKTGIFTITKLNGSVIKIDTALEKISTNFRFDHSTQKLILTLIDGTTQEVDLSALLTQYEFLDSDTIQFTIDSSGKVKASVVNGSITGDMLEPNYLANVTLQASKADTSAKNAKESEEKAAEYAESAKNSADSAEPVASTATGANPTIQDSTNAPIIYGKFKGYTIQDGGPTPDNHIHVDGLGDKGYFDGMLLQGAYNPSTGAYGSANLFLCNKNGIPCKEGDVIRIAYEGEADHVRALFYNDDTFVSQTYSNGNLHTDTVPSGVNVVKFNVYNASGITPSTAKHISVTINGKYAIEVKTIGKNVFSATLEDYQNNGTISGAGTELYFKLKPNTVYTCSSNALKYNDAGDANIWFNGGSSYTHGVNLDNPKTTTTDNDGMLYVALRTSNLEDLFNNYWIQVEEGDTATEYEKPVSSTAAIPTDAPLYEGDYLEVYADGSGKLVRKMKEVVFDGSDDEEWNKSVEGTIYYTILNDAKYSGGDNNVNNVRGLCSHFTMLDSYFNAIIKGDGYCGFGVVSSLSKTMVGINSSSTTVNEWKSWLQSNPVTVVYELAEPTETPLTADQVSEFKKLYTFENVTNVFCNGEAEIRYYKANVNGETVGMLQGMVEKSNETVGVLQDEILKIEENFQKKIESKFIFIGDSYDMYSGWIDKCANLLNIKPENYHNIAKSGTGFFDGSFNTLLRNFRTSITEDYAKEITHIVVCGGVNDSTSTTEEFLEVIYNNIASMAWDAETMFPNATIYLGYIGNALENSSVLENRNYKNRMTLCAYWSGACLDRTNMFYLNNVEYALHNYSYMGEDGLHPNNNGGQSIARHVSNALRNGSADVKFERKEFTVNGNFDVTGEYASYVDNGITSITMAGACFIKNTGFSLSYDIWTDLGVIDSPHFQRFDTIVVKANIADNNYKWKDAHIRMKCENFHLYVSSCDLEESGWATHNNIVILGMEGVVITLPTLQC